MSSGIRVTYVSLLLAAATTLGVALPTPAAAQRVEVFVNGQRVTDIVINGRVNGFRNGAVNGLRNGAVNGFRNGTRVVNGARFVNGARVINGTRIVNGARFVNGRRVAVNGARVVNGANGGNGLRMGFHSHSHIGPYDECFRDRMTGLGHCTGRHWGRHSGPHRGLHRANGSAMLF